MNLLTEQDVDIKNNRQIWLKPSYKRDQAFDNTLASQMRDVDEQTKLKYAVHLWLSNCPIILLQYNRAAYNFSIDELTSMLYECVYDCSHGYDISRGVDYYLWLMTRFYGFVQTKHNYGNTLIHTPVKHKYNTKKRIEAKVIPIDKPLNADGTTLTDIVEDTDPLHDISFADSSYITWLYEKLITKFPDEQKEILQVSCKIDRIKRRKFVK